VGQTSKLSAGNGTGYQQTSIAMTVFQNQARWSTGLFNPQKWIQHFTFDGSCVE